MRTATYAPGRIVLFSEGEYSDFGYCGHVVTLRECNFHDLANEYRAGYQRENEYDNPDPSGFVAWLCACQHVTEINADTLHIGSYGELRISA